LVVVAAGRSQASFMSKLRTPRNLMLVSGAALVVAVVALLSVVVFGGGGGSAHASVDDMRVRTVRLSSDAGSGTGTIIDGRHGLILTNAHVVRPDAPGQGVNYPYRLYLADGKADYVLPESPKEIVVSLSRGADEAADPTYRAEVVAVDGYLDLAVVKITKTLGGTRIDDTDDLHLDQAAIGDSRGIGQNASITVIGYPGVADSESAQVSAGVVSGFRDEDRLQDKRAWINSDVLINRGNSGGPAFDDAGELIAVVTQKRSDDGDTVSRIRPIHLAEALIDAARAGQEYTSPYVTPVSSEKVAAPEGSTIAQLRWATPGRDAFDTSCRDRSADGPVAADVLSMMFDYDGFPDGHQDVLVSVFSPNDGEDPARIATNDQWPVEFHGSGCVAFTVPLPWSLQPGQTYLVSVDVGPNYEKNLIEQNVAT
jgi:S1-C subfamily serine protease